MARPKLSLTRVTATSSESDHVDFWLSDPEPIEDSEGEWGFTVYANQDVWICSFSYPSQAVAVKARHAIFPVLGECVFLATEES